MVIAVDFDGTCVTHEFPKIGQEIGASHVLKCLAENDHQIILYTMRSHLDDNENHAHNSLSGGTINNDTLQEAINWFKSKDIPLFGINENPEQKSWTSSPKIYAHLYIDDAGVGIPLIRTLRFRPFVDWLQIAYILQQKELITGIQLHKIVPLIVQDLGKL